MNVHDLRGQTVAFAASGGLDSCTVTKWLTEHEVTVVAFCADLAQPDETNIDAIRERMLASGATEFVALPLQKQIAAAGLEGIQFQARYEGDYWNTTGIGRHVIVAGMIPEMHKRGITVLGHGCTGRGNDQVRFQLCTNMIDPKIDIYASWRDEVFLSTFRGRGAMIDYCTERNLPIKASKDSPYSTDANLLGLTHEAGVLESLDTPPSFVSPGMGVLPKDAPDDGEIVTIRLENGVPTRINDSPLSLLEAMLKANEIGGRHGVGICTHLVENRYVGIKSRGVYEAPGMELIGTAYKYLLELVLDRRSRELFDHLSAYMAKQIYQGYGFDLGTQMARHAVEPLTQRMTGTIRLRLYKGNVQFESASNCPHSLYSEDDASMEAVGSFNHADSEGFLSVLQVSARAVGVHGQMTLPDWVK